MPLVQDVNTRLDRLDVISSHKPRCRQALKSAFVAQSCGPALPHLNASDASTCDLHGPPKAVGASCTCISPLHQHTEVPPATWCTQQLLPC